MRNSALLILIPAVFGCSASTTVQPDDTKLATTTASAATSATAAQSELDESEHDLVLPSASASAAPTAIPVVSVGNPGDWTKPNPKGKAKGAACSKPDDCQSGVCEGEGCTTGPKCVDANRICTRDLVAFCGCDGKTFSSSGSCPGRPFSKRGPCAP